MTAPVAHAAEAGAGADLLFDEAFLRRLEQLELASRRLTAGRMKGERRSVRRGQSVEFADYRNYSAGDDLRQLDWNVYARLERLFIKLFVEEEDVTVHVLVDASRSMDFGEPNKLTFARRAAGALAYLGLAHLDRVSVAFLGEGRALSLRPLRGKARVFEVFKFLSEPRPERLTGLAAAARDYASRIRGRGPLILVSDLLDPGYLDALRDLAGTRCQLSVLHVLAPEELDPDVPPDARLVDNETGHGIEVTGDDDLVDRYRARLGEWQEELATFCSRRGGAYVSVASDLDLADLLFDVMRRRRVIE
ncbi:MAG TPA: DUF58 domain-containing protein [Methylomirabilota bacterium]|jgi:uncharacterized protein (DUF58 family)|nr:DUF58 domain-containing protein [Methylomirabilota bacterium]